MKFDKIFIEPTFFKSVPFFSNSIIPLTGKLAATIYMYKWTSLLSFNFDFNLYRIRRDVKSGREKKFA